MDAQTTMSAKLTAACFMGVLRSDNQGEHCEKGADDGDEGQGAENQLQEPANRPDDRENG